MFKEVFITKFNLVNFHIEKPKFIHATTHYQWQSIDEKMN